MLEALLLIGALVPLAAMLAALFGAAWLRDSAADPLPNAQASSTDAV